jgi:GGDEF domain-containing protein
MSVISLRKSVSELDHFVEQRTHLQQALARCIQAAGQYCVELRHEDAEKLRANLQRLADFAIHSQDRDSAEQLQADVRGELRAYRDRAQKEAQQLKDQVTQAVTSMQELIATVNSTGTDHEDALRREFTHLEKTAATGDLSAIRAAIRQTIDAALKSCEEIRRSRELVIAQLQDEIRNLHREVDQERRAALRDRSTGLWSRAKLDSRIQDLLLLNESFCVFLIGIRNYSRLAAQQPELLPETLRAVGGRLRSLAGKDGEIGMAGRWSDDTFAIIFNLPLSSAPATIAQIQSKLNGTYAVQLDGSSHSVELSLGVQAIDRPKDSSEGPFFLHLGQAAFSVSAH